MDRLAKTVGALALAAFASAAGAAQVSIVSSQVYYENGARIIDGSVQVAEPAGLFLLDIGGTQEFTAIPGPGLDFTEWLLLEQGDMVSAYTQAAAEAAAVKKYYTATADIGAPEGQGGSYHACPCFEWLSYPLSYNANIPGYAGNFGETVYVYTNEVVLAYGDDPALNFKKTGCEVTGWKLSTNSTDTAIFTPGGKATGADFAATTDGVVLYAVWEKREMAIALDAQGGTAGETNIIALIDETYPELPFPVKRGCSFAGWFTSATGGTQIKAGDKVERDDIDTLYARWTDFTYDLYYGETFDGTYSCTAAVEIASAPYVAGWSLAEGSSVPVFLSGNVEEYAALKFGVENPGDKITLYPVAAEAAISLVDSKGATGETSAKAKIGGVYSLPEPVLAGWTFTGWSSSEVETDPAKLVKNGDAVTSGNIADVFYAQWTAKSQFEVTFIYRNGTGAEATNKVEVYYGDAAVPPVDSNEWAGHPLEGWDDCGFENVTSDIVSKASYGETTYSIVFDPNGGYGRMDDIKGKLFDDEFDLPLNAYVLDTTGAYGFGGWSTVKGGEKEYDDGATVQGLCAEDGGVVVLYAVWDYTLSDNLLSAAADANAVLVKADDYASWEVDDTTFAKGTNCVKATYVRTGSEVVPGTLTCSVAGPGTLSFKWKVAGTFVNSNPGYSYKIGDAAEASQTLPTAVSDWVETVVPVEAESGITTVFKWFISNKQLESEVNLWLDDVKWKPYRPSYVVEFDGDGAEGEMDSEEYAVGEWHTLPFCKFEKEGWSFAHWRNADESEEYFDHGTYTNIAFTGVGETNTLTAVWTSSYYTVTFDYADGSDPEVWTLPFGFEITPPEDPESTGREFAGWSPAIPETVPASNSVYTAQWSLCAFDVVFDSANGSAPVTNKVAYGEAIVAPEDPVKPNATFAGWSPALEPAMGLADQAYVAQWIEEKHWAIFDVGEGAGSEAVLLAYGEAIVPPADPVLAGYEFEGWQPAPAATMGGEDLVYTAKWKKIEKEDGGGESGGGEGEGEGGGTAEDSDLVLYPSGVEGLADFTASAATVYNGWLSEANRLTALVTVKSSVVRKAGAASKVTCTITPISGKKRTVKCEVHPGGTPVNEYGTVFSGYALGGKFEDASIEAARDWSKGKTELDKAMVAAMPIGSWVVVFDTPAGLATFSISIAAKGKAKISGTLANGAKVTATSQALAGESVFAVPVMNAKNAVGFVFALDHSGSGAEVRHISNPGWSVKKIGVLRNMANGTYSLNFMLPVSDPAYISHLDGYSVSPAGEPSIEIAGGKWKTAKAVGKVAAAKDGTVYIKFPNGKTPANISALKLKYAAKTGALTGSFKLYYIYNNKVKYDTVNISGLLIDGAFSGSATIKKRGVSFPVTIE